MIYGFLGYVQVSVDEGLKVLLEYYCDFANGLGSEYLGKEKE